MNSPYPDTATLEGIEAEYMYQFEAGATENVRERMGIATARIGGGVALVMADDPTTYWNKAQGFGATVTGDVVREVLSFFRAHRAPRVAFRIAPEFLPDDWDDIAAAHGLVGGDSHHKLVGRAGALKAGHTDLRVGEIAPEHAREWATVMLESFGMPWEGLGEVTMASVTNPAFRPFGAWAGDQLVATGNLLVQGPVASLSAGTTRPDHRGRGAQSALITARAEAAVAAGCEWVVAETGMAGTSLGNMRRAGLESAYVCREWRWPA